MTFEASRKKQVLVLQPRGKALYEDESSFGSKMLAKMGWNKGQGLGKNQHGSVDFIQIRYKNNAMGLGFNGLKDDQWTQNESNFDNLLKSLNSNQNSAENSNSNSSDEQPAAKKKSLEEKSKDSRARVHYKKFTKGKDVLRYSEKDLANILGKKSLVEVEKPAEETEEQAVQDDEKKPTMYDSNLIINTGMSVTDYFKQQMSKKKGKYEVAENGEEQAVVENGKSEKKSKKRNFEETEETEETFEKTKKSKKRQKSDDEEEVPAEEDQPVKKKKKSKNSEEVEDLPNEEPSKNSKKKKKSKTEPQLDLDEDLTPDPPAQEISKRDRKCKKISESLPETPVESSKKSKKKKKNEIEVEPEAIHDEVTSNSSKKKKKNREIEATAFVPEKTSKKEKKKATAPEPEPDPEPSSKKSKRKSKTETDDDKSFPTSKKISPDEAGEPATSRGANLVYSTNIVQIPSHVAQKLASMSVHSFSGSNLENIIGYGMTEDIEIKVVETKAGEISNSTDKYALYNMDKITVKNVNPRKILSKIKRTKKMIQVI